MGAYTTATTSAGASEAPPCRQRASDAFQSECQARPGGVGCRWDLDLKRVWDVKVRMAQHRRSEQTNGPACA